jgi:hypothetical protein
MDRETVKKILIKSIDKNIKKYGENAIAMMSPRKGKSSWTWKEYKEAVINDTTLKEIENNPIDDVLNLNKYLIEKFNKYLIEKRGYGLEENQINP